LSDIQTLSSDEPIEVNLKDETGFKQKISGAEAGRFAIQGDDTTLTGHRLEDRIARIGSKVRWKSLATKQPAGSTR